MERHLAPGGKLLQARPWGGWLGRGALRGIFPKPRLAKPQTSTQVGYISEYPSTPGPGRPRQCRRGGRAARRPLLGWPKGRAAVGAGSVWVGVAVGEPWGAGRAPAGSEALPGRWVRGAPSACAAPGRRAQQGVRRRAVQHAGGRGSRAVDVRRRQVQSSASRLQTNSCVSPCPRSLTFIKHVLSCSTSPKSPQDPKGHTPGKRRVFELYESRQLLAWTDVSHSFRGLTKSPTRSITC